MKLKEIDFESDASPFDEDYCFEYESDSYEYLDPSTSEHTFRVIKGDDDYDYVEDKPLVERIMKHLISISKSTYVL